LRTFRGHSGHVNALAVASTSGWCASGGQDGNIYLWDLEIPLPGSDSQQEHKSRITAAVNHAAGRLATGSDDQTIRVWENAGNGTNCQVLYGHLGPITCLSHIDGRNLLISGSADRTLKVWSLADGTLQHTLGNHWAAAEQAVKKPRTAASKEEAAVAELRKPSGHRGAVLGIAVLNQSEMVSVGRDGAVRLWNIDTGQETVLFDGGKGPLNQVVADGSRNFIATAGASNQVMRWPATAGSPPQAVIEHQSPVTAIALSDGYLVSGSRDRNVGVYDAHSSTGKLLRGHREIVTAVAVHAGTMRILSGDSHGHIGLWDLRTGRLVGQLGGHRAAIRYIEFLPDGQRAYTISSDGQLACWDLPAARRLASFYCPAQITSFTTTSDALCLGASSGGLVLLQLEDGQRASSQPKTASHPPHHQPLVHSH
jgi:WD40 repeat protein